MARKIVSLLIAVFVTTLIVVKLGRLLFDVQLGWLYIVAPVAFVVGVIVVAKKQRRT